VVSLFYVFHTWAILKNVYILKQHKYYYGLYSFWDLTNLKYMCILFHFQSLEFKCLRIVSTIEICSVYILTKLIKFFVVHGSTYANFNRLIGFRNFRWRCLGSMYRTLLTFVAHLLHTCVLEKWGVGSWPVCHVWSNVRGNQQYWWLFERDRRGFMQITKVLDSVLYTFVSHDR
jgi:hypothetical protein